LSRQLERRSLTPRGVMLSGGTLIALAGLAGGVYQNLEAQNSRVVRLVVELEGVRADVVAAETRGMHAREALEARVQRELDLQRTAEAERLGTILHALSRMEQLLHEQRQGAPPPHRAGDQ